MSRVTSIEDYAYSETGVVSLQDVMGDFTITIGEGAFAYCVYLITAIFYGSVTSIGASAFSGCTSLTTISLPPALTTISASTFSGCTSLTTISLPPALTTISASTFSGCTSLTTVTIPATVTTIGASTFSGCTSLTTVTLPPALTTISANMFSGCTSLTTVTIPDTITSISASVFTGCISLSSIIIPASVTTISPVTFTDCPLSNATVLSLIQTNGFTTDQLLIMGVSSDTIAAAIACFNKNTKILYLNNYLEEEYINVQDLKKGDVVKTYLHGYKKINIFCSGKFINNPDNFRGCMYKMIKNETNGLIDDLIITGGHAIMVDKFTEKEYNETLNIWKIDQVDDKFLLMAGISDKFEQIKERNMHEYYHFSLENDGDIEKRYGVYANGVLVETPCEKDILTFKHVTFFN